MKKPMPLKDLPAYIDSVGDTGQGEIPVVEMGMIVEPRRPFRSLTVFAGATCLLLAGVAVFGFNSTEYITIEAGGLGPEAVARIVSAEGGMFVNVTENEDRTYSVRVLNLRNKNYFLERLRRNEEFRNVESK
jgi:hypothetical protein